MSTTTISTMDSAGRLVLPKEIRDAARFEPGMPLRIICRDGRVEIEAEPRNVRVIRKGRLRIAVPVERSAHLTTTEVRDTTAGIRERRGQR